MNGLGLILILLIAILAFKPRPHFPYLQELRQRLIRVMGFSGTLFCLFFYWDQVLYDYLAKPLLSQLPLGHLIATDITTPFTVPLKTAFVGTCFISIPLVLHQIWAFIAPALYVREKARVFPLLICSLVLFYSGTAFAYWLIIPFSLRFFIESAPASVQIMTDIQSYLNFVLTLLIAGGLAFQIPMISFGLIQTKVCTAAQLKGFRPYVIVGAFTLGMLLTPPDVISQILLALPMWGLFEGGLYGADFIANRLQKHKPEDIVDGSEST
jgi:sec-independent protein translocase protein TatC